jgi:hypothetical protein
MAESYSSHEMKMPQRSKKPAKVLMHMMVKPAENGVSVEHHFTSMEHEPEHHVFGNGMGKEFAAHMMQHSGMSDVQEAEDGGSEESEGNEQA